jgi:hypothetical protein
MDSESRENGEDSAKGGTESTQETTKAEQVTAECWILYSAQTGA